MEEYMEIDEELTHKPSVPSKSDNAKESMKTAKEVSTSIADNEVSITAVNSERKDLCPIPNTTEIPIASKTEKDDPTNTSCTSKNGPLDGWTKDEKYDLYLGIKSKGSKKIHEIQKSIPTKTIAEIKAAISHYCDKVNNNPECTTKKLKARKVRTKPLIPLASWAKALTDNLSYDDLQTETVSALRLIADLDDIPDPVLTDLINFRKIYHQIADAMEGKTLIDNRLIMEVISSCVLDTALVSKVFINASTYRHILSSVSFKDKVVPVFPRPTENIELAIIRHLVGLVNYNPLNISEEHLTSVGYAASSSYKHI